MFQIFGYMCTNMRNLGCLEIDIPIEGFQVFIDAYQQQLKIRTLPLQIYIQLITCSSESLKLKLSVKQEKFSMVKCELASPYIDRTPIQQKIANACSLALFYVTSTLFYHISFHKGIIQKSSTNIKVNWSDQELIIEGKMSKNGELRQQCILNNQKIVLARGYSLQISFNEIYCELQNP
ncbi:hypothetical protein FGO68_gene7748 [Halteria grandinella]|uniref:Uncharacterized protein n=1 Tax=Halteria grandinella TaxID=5974 RepID=A0A8J8NZD0_HALGN|nr:hypothetical protein FGO68_gene7748 [Halteria grandinella]